MNINEINIGDIVREKMPPLGGRARYSIDMEVVGVYKDSKGGVAYLDFEGNEGDVWEVDVKDLELVRKWNEVTDERCCGACRHFAYEDTDGYGYCLCPGDGRPFVTKCGNVCGNFKDEGKTAK